MRLSLTSRQFRRNIETALVDINAYLLLLEQWSFAPPRASTFTRRSELAGCSVQTSDTSSR